MFQNTKFSEEHCEKLPSLGMMVGGMLQYQKFQLVLFLQAHNEACKKKKNKCYVEVLMGKMNGKKS